MTETNGHTNGCPGWTKLVYKETVEHPPQQLTNVGVDMVRLAAEKMPDAGCLVILAGQDTSLFAFGGYPTINDALEALLEDVVDLYESCGITLTVEGEDDN
jgi:hypothetical protein